MKSYSECITFIEYGGRGFKGELTINTLEFFPIPINRMAKLIKICQMSSCCEEIYLLQFKAALKTLQKHSAFFSHRKNKLIQADLNFIEFRLNCIGGRQS